MIDLGITFPEGENDPGIDVILPDLRFIEEERANLVGLVLTHAHEDHLGAVIELWPRLKVPIYATPFTAAMLKSKLADYGGKLKLPIEEVPLNARFDVGPFDLELIAVAHSIPEPNAVAIRTSHGVVLHTGDWKIDATPTVGPPTDEARLRQLGTDGVLAMICDSTNALRAGRSPSEMDVAKSLADIIKGAKRRVAVTIFASNVARIKAVADAARACGRHVVVAGRAMHRIIGVAMETGYLPVNFKYHDQQHFSYLEPHEVVLLCTGSQGEPRAAVARIAEDQHPEVRAGQGRPRHFLLAHHPRQRAHRRPHPEPADRPRLRDRHRRRRAGARHRPSPPRGADGDVRLGEAAHRHPHARRGAASVRARQARARRRREGGAQRAQRRHGAPGAGCGRDHRRGAGGASLPRRRSAGAERRRAGARAPVAGVCRRRHRRAGAVGRGEVVADAEIALDGVPAADAEGRPMVDIVREAIEGTIASIPRDRRRDGELVREAVRRAVRSAVEDAWGKRPIAKVLLTQAPR